MADPGRINSLIHPHRRGCEDMAREHLIYLIKDSISRKIIMVISSLANTKTNSSVPCIPEDLRDHYETSSTYYCPPYPHSNLLG